VLALRAHGPFEPLTQCHQAHNPPVDGSSPSRPTVFLFGSAWLHRLISRPPQTATREPGNKTLIEHWNGSKWVVVHEASLSSGGGLEDVSAISKSYYDIWSVPPAGIEPATHGPHPVDELAGPYEWPDRSRGADRPARADHTGEEGRHPDDDYRAGCAFA